PRSYLIGGSDCAGIYHASLDRLAGGTGAGRAVNRPALAGAAVWDWRVIADSAARCRGDASGGAGGAGRGHGLCRGLYFYQVTQRHRHTVVHSVLYDPDAAADEPDSPQSVTRPRSEERRVGKRCRSRWAASRAAERARE